MKLKTGTRKEGFYGTATTREENYICYIITLRLGLGGKNAALLVPCFFFGTQMLYTMNDIEIIGTARRKEEK